MSLMPDQQPDPRKEALLAKAPFTKNFLDEKAMKSDLSGWAKRQNDLTAKLQEEVRSKTGNDWRRTIIAPSLISANIHGIFNPDMDVNEKIGVATGLFLMGWEVGSDNFNPLLTDIVVQFGKLKVFNPKLLGSHDDRNKIVDTCTGLLRVGQYFKRLTPQEINLEKGGHTPTPDPFKKFIEGIDLSGI